MTRVKICGITRLEDALAAAEFGADALGFIFEETSPRFIGRSPGALAIPARLPPFVQTVAVYAHAADIPVERSGRYDAIQFITCPDVLRTAFRRQIKVLRLSGREALDEGREWEDRVDAFLLDAYHPDKLGGAGVTADWDLAAEVTRSLSRPVILAGGLNPDNVVEAIAQVKPYAVDVSSGVEASPGVKDHEKLEAFIRAAHGRPTRI
jgi:phosphoribosylanthranilate isomerase